MDFFLKLNHFPHLLIGQLEKQGTGNGTGTGTETGTGTTRAGCLLRFKPPN